MRVRIFDDASALSHGAAELFVQCGRSSIMEQGAFHVAIAGGSTPKSLYHLLADEPYCNYLDWSKVFVYWGDERYVPAEDSNSNEGMARVAFLNKVPIPEDQIFPMFRPSLKPQEAAQAYEETLSANAPNGLSLVLLGMGGDGHTASLFPGIPELMERKRFVVPTISPQGIPQRITITFPYFEMSHQILFMVSGKEKCTQLQLALGTNSANWPPAGQLAHAVSDRVSWYVDQSAYGND